MKGGFIDTPTGIELRKRSGYDNVATMSAFVNYILTNSATIKILSMSSLYGVVYQVKLASGVPTPVALHDFTSCQCQLAAYPGPQKPQCSGDTFLDSNFPPISSSCLAGVDTFILKLALMGPVKDALYTYTNPETGQRLQKATEVVKDFAEESTAQYEIYNKEFNAGLSIVPPVISSKPIVFQASDPTIQQTRQFFASKLPQFEEILRAGSTAKDQYGKPAPANGFAFIPMLFASGYTTISDIMKSSYSPDIKEKALVLASWALSRLGLVYRKLHGDAHMGNVMVNVNATGEFLKTTDPHKFELGKVLIIDLGRTSVIPDQVFQKIAMSQNQLYTLMNYEIERIGPEYVQYHWPLGPAGYTGNPNPSQGHNEWFQKVLMVENRYKNTVSRLNSKLSQAANGADFTDLSVDEYNRKLNQLPPYAAPPPDPAAKQILLGPAARQQPQAPVQQRQAVMANPVFNFGPAAKVARPFGAGRKTKRRAKKKNNRNKTRKPTLFK
jgi:hypothetical protein